MFKILFFIMLNIAVFGGFMLAGGNLSTIWQPAEFVIIIGAAISALLISVPMAVIKTTGQQIKALWSKEQEDPDFYKELICLTYELFNQLRLKGFKVLDEHIDEPETSELFSKYPAVLKQPQILQFLADNLRIQSMAKISPHDLAHLMDEEIEQQEADMMRPSEVLFKIGEACPGFGIMAAVMGIIIAMGFLDGALSMIGVKVGAALVGTFVGIYLCYALLHPISSALEHMVQMRIARYKALAKMITYFAKDKPPLLAVDAGRRQIQTENRPSFIEMEQWLVAPSETPVNE
ncbi:flagellar motor stator protein MotA [Ferrimonas lipolytica]|uniref:Flagellar motor stator protein MotA n=1 Tax=Ferrimonas lipolytica TaxID=2724191 RepID=A0A6H1UCI8_9GAMM|nr:flagellar motor stator protein MotA [Ferrimonas lipolytica]QIZ76795.1 flagellar motor stator protein MotA [Ferrimonas lipolytica]